MLVNIFLVKFELDTSCAYIDGMSDLVESVSVPLDIFRSLIAGKDGVKYSQLEVYEDENRSVSFHIGCYLPDDVARLRARLREVFLDKLRESATEFGPASVKQVDVKLLETILGLFKILTSLDALLTRKLEGFLDDDSMVVRVDINE